MAPVAPSLILASRSPQRQAILQQIGVRFAVRAADVDELDAGPPEEVVLENAYRKAIRVAQGTGPTDPPVLGVDTVVSFGSLIYGQPRDESDAAAMLRALGGERHRVLSGVCVIDAGRVRSAAAVTAVQFGPIDEVRLRWYLATGEWRGRAGGYAIQGAGAALVQSIEGDYLNIVGLPVSTLLELLPGIL
ncbi:MAG: nucleoside triphosphate pyrophosphatase [Solirubrobacteraceae bacterium]